MTIVIGIDPGFATVGYGVIESSGRGVRPVAYGVIKTSPLDGDAPFRLAKIRMEFLELIETYNPDIMSIEELFFSKNTSSAMQVSEARGVLLVTAEEKGLLIFGYKPNQVKQAVTGSGRADKIQMQTMIQRLLSLKKRPTPDDAADALCLALCHINRSRVYL